MQGGMAHRCMLPHVLSLLRLLCLRSEEKCRVRWWRRGLPSLKGPPLACTSPTPTPTPHIAGGRWHREPHRATGLGDGSASRGTPLREHPSCSRCGEIPRATGRRRRGRPDREKFQRCRRGQCIGHGGALRRVRGGGGGIRTGHAIRSMTVVGGTRSGRCIRRRGARRPRGRRHRRRKGRARRAR